MPSVSTNTTQIPALPNIPSTRKWIFQEDEYADWNANDAVSAFNNMAERTSQLGILLQDMMLQWRS